MNKLIFVILALVLIASQAFKTRAKQDSPLEDDFKQVFLHATQFTQVEINKIIDTFKALFPDEYAAWQTAVRDGQKITADIISAMMQSAQIFAAAAAGSTGAAGAR